MWRHDVWVPEVEIPTRTGGACAMGDKNEASCRRKMRREQQKLVCPSTAPSLGRLASHTSTFIDQDVPTRWCRCRCCSSLRCSAFFVQYQRRQISLFGCWDFSICSRCCFYYSYLQCSRRRMPPRRGQNKRRRKAKAPPTTAIYSSYSATKSKCTYWAPFIFVFSWCLCRR